MAKRSSNGKPTAESNNGNWQSKLLQVEFTDKQRSEVNEWLKEREDDPYRYLEQHLRDGYKFSVTYSEYYDTFYTSISPKNTNTRYDKYTVTTTHPNYVKALHIISYLVEVLMANNAIPLRNESTVEDW